MGVEIDAKRLRNIGNIMMRVALVMKTARMEPSALSSCGTVLKMGNRIHKDKLVTSGTLEFAQDHFNGA